MPYPSRHTRCSRVHIHNVQLFNNTLPFRTYPVFQSTHIHTVQLLNNALPFHTYPVFQSTYTYCTTIKQCLTLPYIPGVPKYTYITYNYSTIPYPSGHTRCSRVHIHTVQLLNNVLPFHTYPVFQSTYTYCTTIKQYLTLPYIHGVPEYTYIMYNY